MVYQAPRWSIELLGGWTPIVREDHVAVEAPSRDAAFHVSSFDAAEAGTDAASWIEAAAHFNRRRGRVVDPVAYGDFRGYRTETVSGGRWFRGHVLRAGDFPLDVTYSCPESAAHRDDAPLDSMLASLKVRQVSGRTEG